MENIELDFFGLLKVLVTAEVEFVVVGGVGAVLQGAPIATFDLDIVHRRTPGNIDRLLEALGSINARYRGQGERVIRPEQSHLLSVGHQLLMTDKGPLDVLGMIGAGQEYEGLLDQTLEMEVGGLTALAG